MAAPTRATRGLFDEFGAERVIDTPISEAMIGGAAVGAAMTGMRPVAEIMYVDFTPLAMDQIANQGAKNRYMFGGKTTVPMVIRTEGGAGRSIAAHHSQSLEALWTHFPGIYVVMPATPYDAKGLLKTCHPRRQPGDVHRAQDALRQRRPRARRGVYHPLGRRRRQARGRGCDHHHLLAHGAALAGGRGQAGRGGHQRRGDRPALAQAAGHGDRRRARCARPVAWWA